LSSIERQTIQTFYQGFFDQGIHMQYQIVDQYAIAAAIFDDVVEKEVTVYATVETKSPVTLGQVVIDWTNMSHKKANVSIVLGLKSDVIKEHLKSMLH